VIAETLRERAREYELRAVAAGDQGDERSAEQFKTAAVVLYEVAEAYEEEAA
jgi:hypothetical protein